MQMRILHQWVEGNFAWVEAFDLDTGVVYVLSGHLNIIDGMQLTITDN